MKVIHTSAVPVEADAEPFRLHTCMLVWEGGVCVRATIVGITSRGHNRTIIRKINPFWTTEVVFRCVALMTN